MVNELVNGVLVNGVLSVLINFVGVGVTLV